MSKRLPPQPTDTALARVVRCLIDRLPGASIRTRRRLEEQLEYSRKVERLALCEATEAKRAAYQRGQEMQHMARSFAEVRAIPFPPIDVLRCMDAGNPLTGEPGQRITVSFRPLAVEYRIRREILGGKSKPDLDGVLRTYLQDATRSLARTHADELETTMLRHLLATLGIENPEGKGARP